MIQHSKKDLIDAYPIKRAVIVPDLVENEQILLQDVCAALIDDLPRYVKSDSVIGVFYGHTLTALHVSFLKSSVREYL